MTALALMVALGLSLAALSVPFCAAGAIHSIYKQDPNNVPFMWYPMIMSHDAASGYFPGVGSPWVKTQTVDLVGQLNCGARALDYRPLCTADTLTVWIIAAHGIVPVFVKMENSVDELLAWTRANPNELVVLFANHFAGTSDCKARVIELLNTKNVPVITNVTFLSSSTYADVFAFAELPNNGGHLVTIFDVDERYVDTPRLVVCYEKSGKFLRPENVCYGNGKEIMFNYFDQYMTAAVAKNDSGTNDARPWMAQAHWQYSAKSIALGTTHLSSIIKDTDKSNINGHVLNAINNKIYPQLNFLELDNVCNQGPAIKAALDQVYLSFNANRRTTTITDPAQAPQSEDLTAWSPWAVLRGLF